VSIVRVRIQSKPRAPTSSVSTAPQVSELRMSEYESVRNQNINTGRDISRLASRDGAVKREDKAGREDQDKGEIIVARVGLVTVASDSAVVV
jgi:hypothetical protein